MFRNLQLSILYVTLTCLAIASGNPTPDNSLCNCNYTAAYFAPVCGSNGKTYNSWKELKCINFCNKSQIKISYAGKCVMPCPCNIRHHFITAPVCGNDGRTYASSDVLECKNRCFKTDVKIVSMGEC